MPDPDEEVAEVRTPIAAVTAVGLLLVACSPPDLTPDDGDGVPGPAVAEEAERDDPLAGDPFADTPDAALIEEGYPVAADAAEHRSEACVTRGGGAAEVRVEVVATDGGTAGMVYLLVDEDGWAIAGAVPLEVDGPDTTTV